MKFSLNQHKKNIFTILSLLITLLIFSYLFKQVSLKDVINSLQNIDFFWTFWFFIFSLIMSAARALRYKVMLRSLNQNSNLLALFCITLVRNLCSDILPARLGTLVYIFLAKTKLNVSLSSASSSFAFSLLFDIAAIAPLFILALLGSSSELSVLPMLTIASSLFVFSLLLILNSGKLCNFCLILIDKFFPSNSIKNTLRNFLKNLQVDFAKYQSKKILLEIFFLSVVIRIAKYLSLSCFLFALIVSYGYDPLNFGFSKSFIGIASAELAASLPVSGIGGFGLYEGTWSYAFSLLGLPEKLSTLTAISHHLFTQFYGLIMGLFGTIAIILFKFPSKRD